MATKQTDEVIALL